MNNLSGQKNFIELAAKHTPRFICVNHAAFDQPKQKNSPTASEHTLFQIEHLELKSNEKQRQCIMRLM